jgi:hypothetical protein
MDISDPAPTHAPPRTPAGRSPSPPPFSKQAFSSFPAGVPKSSSRPNSPRSGGRTSPRPGSPRQQHSAFGSTVSPRKKPLSPSLFFTASQRGGALTEPLPQRGLTDFERERPEMLKGPSLLHREKFGAKKSDWERYKAMAMGAAEAGGNFLEDDNPFNDPFKYHPFKGMAFPPKDYIGPDDARETDSMEGLQPGNALRLSFVHGCAQLRSNP